MTAGPRRRNKKQPAGCICRTAGAWYDHRKPQEKNNYRFFSEPCAKIPLQAHRKPQERCYKEKGSK